jgi:hypothetical protein
MAKYDSCPCEDFEPEEPGSPVCTCGHVDEEHTGRVFRPCKFNPDA